MCKAVFGEGAWHLATPAHPAEVIPYITTLHSTVYCVCCLADSSLNHVFTPCHSTSRVPHSKLAPSPPEIAQSVYPSLTGPKSFLVEFSGIHCSSLMLPVVLHVPVTSTDFIYCMQLVYYAQICVDTSQTV